MIALLTDFGYEDVYVGVMKSVISSIAPDSTIIDLSHGIEPGNISSASYLLYSAIDYLPDGSVVCAVVDPGVGSDRRILIAQLGHKFIIAPDNGLLSLTYQMHPELDIFVAEPVSLIDATADNQPFGPVEHIMSHTFHGRDIFAPTAALLDQGRVDLIGVEVDEWVRLDLEVSVHIQAASSRQSMHGRIIHFDHFGNAITNIHRQHFESRNIDFERIYVVVDELILRGAVASFTAVETGQELFYFGSSGFLEIAINQGHAQNQFNLETGQSVEVNF